jgi:hypothetical protein
MPDSVLMVGPMPDQLDQGGWLSRDLIVPFSGMVGETVLLGDRTAFGILEKDVVREEPALENRATPSNLSFALSVYHLCLWRSKESEGSLEGPTNLIDCFVMLAATLAS